MNPIIPYISKCYSSIILYLGQFGFNIFNSHLLYDYLCNTQYITKVYIKLSNNHLTYNIQKYIIQSFNSLADNNCYPESHNNFIAIYGYTNFSLY